MTCTLVGHWIDYDDPSSFPISLIDISNALSNICRWGGHTLYPYSVAQHSWLLSYAVPRSLSKAALLHDAAEAYIGDIVTPLKKRIDFIEAFEASILGRIGDKYGVTSWEFEWVKPYDRRICIDEAQKLNRNDSLIDLLRKEIGEPLGVEIERWRFEHAREMFLDRCEELGIHD